MKTMKQPTQASVMGEFLLARGWEEVRDEDQEPHQETTWWSWPASFNTRYGGMETQITVLGEGEVEVIRAHEVGHPAMAGMATRRMSGQACRVIIEDIEAFELTDEIIERDRSQIEAVMDSPEVQLAIWQAVALITGGRRIGEVMVMVTGDEMRMVIDDVHVLGDIDHMGQLAQRIAQVVEDGAPGCMWADAGDAVTIQRRQDGRIEVEVESGRYGTATRLLSVEQARELAQAIAEAEASGGANVFS